MFNKFAAPEVEEEKARMRALVETLNDDEGEEENEEEKDTLLSN